MPAESATFARLGRWPDVQKQMTAARAAGAQVTHDRDAGAVVADLTGEGDVIFRALLKGDGVWLVIYTRKFFGP
jgi:hypothetical protein